MKTKTTEKVTLYRGEKYGVFTGANGYYVSAMSDDGVSHYQPRHQGLGWSERILRECNDLAEMREESEE